MKCSIKVAVVAFVVAVTLPLSLFGLPAGSYIYHGFIEKHEYTLWVTYQDDSAASCLVTGSGANFVTECYSLSGTYGAQGLKLTNSAGSFAVDMKYLIDPALSNHFAVIQGNLTLDGTHHDFTASAQASKYDTAPPPYYSLGFPDPKEFESFVRLFQRNVVSGEKEAVASMMSYPVYANFSDGSRQKLIKDEFIASYDKIFYKEFVNDLKTLSFQDAHINWKGVRLAGSNKSFSISFVGSMPGTNLVFKVYSIDSGTDTP